MVSKWLCLVIPSFLVFEGYLIHNVTNPCMIGKVGTQILEECLNCCILIVFRTVITPQSSHEDKSSKEDLITLYPQFPWLVASYNLPDSPPLYCSPSTCSYCTIENPNMWGQPLRFPTNTFKQSTYMPRWPLQTLCKA